MGYHALGSLEVSDRMVHVNIYIDRNTYVHVCGNSELEYSNGRKDFILGPRLGEVGGGDDKFSVLFKRGTENF